MLELTQSELSDAVDNGDGFIVHYRTIYEIVWSHGAKEYVERKVYRSYDDLPLMPRGRFMFANRDTVERLMLY